MALPLLGFIFFCILAIHNLFVFITVWMFEYGISSNASLLCTELSRNHKIWSEVCQLFNSIFFNSNLFHFSTEHKLTRHM